MKRLNYIMLIVALTVIWLPVTSVSAANKPIWDWKMPGELYKKLNHLQRSRIDKAAAIFKTADDHRTSNDSKRKEDAIRYFRASALEWKKIRVQAGDVLDDSTLAYVIFMEGYSHHFALDRYKAVRTYTEVVDYFPNEIWIAVPALYYRSMAHFENGDDRDAYAGFLVIADDDHKQNPDEAKNAANKLKQHFVFQNQFSKIDEFIREEAKASVPEDIDPAAVESARMDILCHLIRWTGDDFRHGRWNDWYYSRFFTTSKGETLRIRDRCGLIEWFALKEKEFASADRSWDFHWGMTYYLTWNPIAQPDKNIKAMIDILRSGAADATLSVERGRSLMGILADGGRRDEASRAFEHISGAIRRSNLTAMEKENLAEQMMHTLSHHHFSVEARSLLDLYTSTIKSHWAEYRVAEAGNDWKEAITILERFESIEDEGALRESREKRASIHKDHTREYEKAIELFRKLADPPKTLWEIQECYRRAGKTQQAHDTLSEIAGSFPDDAARAVYTRAEYYREDGEHKLAVSLYRQILMRFKDSSQSSSAHQRLEDYGVESGGGVIDPL